MSKALIEMTENNRVWNADSQDERLRLAFVQFTRECKRHRVRCWDTFKKAETYHCQKLHVPIVPDLIVVPS